jgi:hypothetical protein
LWQVFVAGEFFCGIFGENLPHNMPEVKDKVGYTTAQKEKSP